MGEGLGLFVVIAIVMAVAYVAITGGVGSITDNVARIEQAKAVQVQAHEEGKTERTEIAEAAHTERFQTFALTITGLAVIAKSPDALLILLLIGLYGAAGYALWRTRARG